MTEVIQPEDGPLDPQTVLKQEAKAIHGIDLGTGENTSNQSLYRDLNELGNAALCLSGGGIRSAAFSLGIIQALASARRPREDGGEISLLEQFHYLSTVSGGGYIGSWLSTWLSRADGDTANVVTQLAGRPGGPDKEPAEISWLRSYSNYLTPKLGLMSADFWADIALYLRNLVLNWFVIIPSLLVTLLFMKVFLIGFHATSHDDDIVYFVLGSGVLCLLFSASMFMRNRPTSKRGKAGQEGYLAVVLLPSIAAAILFAAAAGSQTTREFIGSFDRPVTLGWLAAAGAAIYFAAWCIGRRRVGIFDSIAWSIAGAFYGAFLGFGLFEFLHTADRDVFRLGIPAEAATSLLLLILGPPWSLLGQITAEMIFVGLTSYQTDSDADREWLGRSAGWITAAAIGWLLFSGLALVGAELALKAFAPIYAAVGGISGLATALIGFSKRSPAIGGTSTKTTFSLNLILAITAPIFGACLIIGGAAVLDELFLGHQLLNSRIFGALNDRLPSVAQDIYWIVTGTITLGAVGAIASWCVNINRFSMHALYRNRLIRAFLGASNKDHRKDANRFTGFALSDNLPMSNLWPLNEHGVAIPLKSWHPFHIINIALNIVSTQKLAWQERKAESFTISPLHSGSACKAFRRTAAYGDPKEGISVGTAVAISGAAVSPNQGYHSSPAVSFLMGLLNVRLGWWLGNPGEKGNRSFRLEGPQFAIKPFLIELFGLTTDDQPYVYLSDGGHFENLGIYEMVRRRCRFILAVDAGCDKEFALEDLGNAVRKISIDLGVTISFTDLNKLRSRQPDSADLPAEAPYAVLGTIHYVEADRGGTDGVLLYLKAGYHGTEAADVRSYAIANQDFPHQSTADQWFSESQFESYRRLGFDIGKSTVESIWKNLPKPPVQSEQIVTS